MVGCQLSIEQDKPQPGVQHVEAMAATWSKTSFITTYVLIWIVYFVMLIQHHQHIAVIMAIVSMFSSIGAIGGVIAGAIWQSIFP